jgi:hypothetical protein
MVLILKGIRFLSDESSSSAQPTSQQLVSLQLQQELEQERTQSMQERLQLQQESQQQLEQLTQENLHLQQQLQSQHEQLTQMTQTQQKELQQLNEQLVEKNFQLQQELQQKEKMIQEHHQLQQELQRNYDQSVQDGLRLRQELQQQKIQLEAAWRDEVFRHLELLLINYPSVHKIAQMRPDLAAQSITSMFTPLGTLLQSWGYEAIGTPLEQVPFHPQFHQADVDTIQAEELVFVRFVGYRHGETILCPAKVSRTLAKSTHI